MTKGKLWQIYQLWAHGSSLRDSNYDRCSMSYAVDRKTPNTHKIYLLPKRMSSIVLFTIHFLEHSLKILMKSWQTLVDSGLNRSTNSTCVTRYGLIDVWCIQIHRKKTMSIALQSTSKVTLKSLIFPSPYAMFKCSSSVEEGKEKLYWNFSPVAIFVV